MQAHANAYGHSRCRSNKGKAYDAECTTVFARHEQRCLPVGGCCPCTWVCFALQKHLDTRKIPLRTSSKHQRSHLNKFKKRWYKPLPPVRFGLLVIIYIHPLEYIYKYIHIYIYTSAGIYLYVFGVGQKHFLRTRSHCCS